MAIVDKAMEIVDGVMEVPAKNDAQTLNIQMLFDAAGDAREFFYSKNPKFVRALQNLDLYTPNATELCNVLWFMAYGQGVFDTLGLTDMSFKVTDVEAGIFNVQDFRDEVKTSAP
ncbi:MAG: hypothetical protein LBT09_08230 [Planctomycetaceae bacterium]|jgi:hypothetical protein|nr:hypothetical protein [Planctomycetaceae bacterium]